MRNLRILQSAAYGIASDLPISAQTFDTSTDSLIVAFGPCKTKEVIELRKIKFNSDRAEDNSKVITSWDAPCPLAELEFDQIICLHHFAHSETTCLVLAGGDIIVVRSRPLSGQEKIEIVGSVDVGITGAAWSPDDELLALTTRAKTLLLMTAEFDNVADISFNPEDTKLSKHVSVGWGKAETQFKGKRAKAMRDPTMPETVDEGTLSAHDDGNITISWRGDGAYVAINAIEAGLRRMIRVYSRDGILDSVTEPVDGLEAALSWRPAGNLLAGIQHINNIVNVIFFERNGLRHGQFPLRLTDNDLKTWASRIELCWNVDSSVLAVSFIDRVQLWTMGNYHYYLKQTLQCVNTEKGNHTARVNWHPDQALQFALFRPSTNYELQNVSTYNGSRNQQEKYIIQVYRFISFINGGPNESSGDIGVVAVVDGRNLKVTPLRIANVPPPMALCDIELEAEIKDVAVSITSTRFAVLHEQTISILHTLQDLRTTEAFSGLTIEQILDLPVVISQKPNQIVFQGDQHIYVLYTDIYTGRSTLYDIQKEEFQELPEEVSSNVSSIFTSVDHKMICVATNTAISEVQHIGGIIQARKICETATVTPWTEVVTRSEGSIAFGLSFTGMLYANERLLLRGCTSFLLTSSYLIVTTANHLLKFIHLTDVQSLEVPPDEPELDERCRSVERGAKLVTVMPSSFSLTLQMPRGNLETIYPRALVLASIRRSIEEKRFWKAFLACRSQRVDMNILHDHNPEAFLSSIELIVKQLRSIEYIDLFLSQLRNEDVSKTMYKETLPRPALQGQARQGLPTISDEDKVNRICDAFLEVLQTKYDTNLQNVITAHVCKVPPNLEAGLSVIANLREKQPDMAEMAVEHICFLADVNHLYDTALGMYDLDLALLVAQQSQKDPREYLPYLQSLQEVPQLRKQFKIDDDLGRYVKAVRHLHSLQSVDEVQTYTQRHELFKDVLELYRYELENHALILKTYADFLNSKHRFREAAIAYESLSDHVAASRAYSSAGLWREALSNALAVPLPSDEITSLANSLADSLIESKDYAAVAAIHLEHLSDIESAARYLCKGFLFAEATRTIRFRNRADLLPNTIDAGLVEASATLTELLADCKSQLGAQVPRLRELRKVKLADPLAFFEGAADNPNIPDDISIAPSTTSTSGGASLFTRYTVRSGTNASTLASNTTRKSSKNRRREERKRARGKKGSVYEEEYLVNSIGRLIERVNDTAGDVERTVAGLLSRGMWERARAVENAMVEVVAACAACTDEVWEKAVVGTEGLEELGERPAGADGVVWDSLAEERRGRVAPAVKGFVPSGLLG